MDLAQMPSIFSLAGCLAVGASACWLALQFVGKLKGRVDASGRDFHHRADGASGLETAVRSSIPRFGGVGFAAALIAAILFCLVFVPAAPEWLNAHKATVLCSLAMFGLGVADDIKRLRGRTKLLLQCVIASAVYFSGIQIEVLRNPLTDAQYALGISSFFITVFWLVALTNLINLVDGIDGLAGGISLMLMALLAYVSFGVNTSVPAMLATGMAGALLVFLRFNYPPAKIYMGDGGAYLLGFLIGILSIINSHKGSVVAALLATVFALALPIADVALAIARRAFKGLPIFRPDRKHIHHQLITLGFSRRGAVLLLYGISFLCLVLAFGVFWSQGRLLPLVTGCLFLAVFVGGRSFGLFDGWPALKLLAHGHRLSSALRQESRYALTLSQWLEMEAERRDSVYELWQDFQFVAQRLGFIEVTLQLPDTTNVWRSDREVTGAALVRAQYQISAGTRIEFAADLNTTSEKTFELLAELAAETWHKAAARWQSCHQKPVEFISVASPDTSYWRKKVAAFSAPLTANLGKA